ncbi:MAG TPA: serine hydrolase, partial [Agriterribacter sp.]|nr:serine hydrolase [Agriterribacter sp.]
MSILNNIVVTPKDSITVVSETDTIARTKEKPVTPMPLPISKKDNSRTDAFLADLLRRYPAYFDTIVKKRKDFGVQIIYTQINRDGNNKPEFKDYYFNVNDKDYFYPASTVKMPTALLALQRLNELNLPGITRQTTMITENAYSGQTPVYNDPTSPDGSPNIEQYIKKIFLVSDNDAFNRLYEFLGPQYINEQLHAKGYKDAQIIHRLELSLTEDENRHTNPVQFRNDQGKVIYTQPMQNNTVRYAERNDLLGKAYYNDGVLIDEPMNFSAKNRISLQDLHAIIRSIMFPQSVPASERFNITPEQYRFVWQYMSQLPRETDYPSYDSTFYDAYGKFLLLGADKSARLPSGLRIFNKTGDAYGFLIDAAYLADFENNIEFMLSAVIYCNENQTLNDDTYEYDSIGFPFMKRLGEVIYNYELKRDR